ncbi:MAG TPA: hypothetical protein VNE61_15650 [Ktedonobacteraceae bacterium]|nr:hypothetical protein [Ktedonobacteraceae bacterium]
MALTCERFRSNFGIYPVPDILKELLAFQEISSQWYSWGFELSVITSEELQDHVPTEVVAQFLGFGHDGNYSIYALWKYKEMLLDEAPVVYFNSEGEGSGVQASNLADFFTLLAIDQEPIFGVYSEQAGKDIKHTNRNEEFREWLEQRYHLHADEHPNDMVQQARHRHPKVPLLYPAG